MMKPPPEKLRAVDSFGTLGLTGVDYPAVQQRLYKRLDQEICTKESCFTADRQTFWYSIHLFHFKVCNWAG